MRKRRQKDIRVSDFALYWSFSSDVTAVNELILIQREDLNKNTSELLYNSIVLNMSLYSIRFIQYIIYVEYMYNTD